MKLKQITGLILAVTMSISSLTVLDVRADDVEAAATITYNNHTYSLFDYSIPWENAKAYCENLGGYLVTITSEAEQEQIESLISSGSKGTYWIGLRETGTEGNWNWVTGEDYDYTNWGSGEPNDSGGEAYCEIVKTPWDALTFGTWNDMKNSGDTSGITTIAYKGFICEWGDYSISAKWTVSDNVLIIYDMGTETDFEAGEAKWYESRAAVDTLYISEGVANIGENAFYGFSGLKTVVIPDSIVNIDNEAFAGCSSIEEVYCYKGSAADNTALYSAAGLTGDNIYYIGDVNFDRNISTEDAAMMAKFSSGITECGEIRDYVLDCNYDGVFDMLDAVRVLKGIGG